MSRRGYGRAVTLTSDPSQDGVDRYGRLLAYVATVVDVNRRMVRSGWADVYVFEGVPFARVDAYRREAEGAKAASRGVWGRCGGDFHRPL